LNLAFSPRGAPGWTPSQLTTVPARTCDFADELEEIETLISSNKQRVKTASQIAREGAELQRIEAERAALRRRATQNNEAARAVPMNSKELGESLDAVAASLGISRDRWYKIRTVFERAHKRDPAAEPGLGVLHAPASRRVLPSPGGLARSPSSCYALQMASMMRHAECSVPKSSVRRQQQRTIARPVVEG
jgi:hypothetical protein